MCLLGKNVSQILTSYVLSCGAPRWRPSVMRTWWCRGCQWGTGSCMAERSLAWRSPCWTPSEPSGSATDPTSSSNWGSEYTAVNTLQTTTQMKPRNVQTHTKSEYSPLIPCDTKSVTSSHLSVVSKQRKSFLMTTEIKNLFDYREVTLQVVSVTTTCLQIFTIRQSVTFWWPKLKKNLNVRLWLNTYRYSTIQYRNT